ncbi:AAA family ATPase [Pedococcus sp. NPDC057267]|uniref:AAA family ATPase n=1 Tax=Pedococcus sp. NPDC057267 TaxID=3346077 RepID=UPI0036269205
MSRLIHLNGPPGIGKSTLARRYADEHPGVLNCDVDVLRTLVGGWRTDFDAAGALIRPAALAMIGAYLRHGHDVVFPQLLVDPTELGRFEQAATDAGAQFVERALMDTRSASVARFHRRGVREPDDPWHDHIRAIVTSLGGDALLERTHTALERAVADRPDAVVVPSTEGDVEGTYRALLMTLR